MKDKYVIEVENLTKKFGYLTAVKDLSFTIYSSLKNIFQYAPVSTDYFKELIPHAKIRILGLARIFKEEILILPLL